MIDRKVKYQGREYPAKVKYINITFAYEECELYTPTKSYFINAITDAITSYNNRKLDYSTRYDIYSVNEIDPNVSETDNKVQDNSEVSSGSSIKRRR